MENCFFWCVYLMFQESQLSALRACRDGVDKPRCLLARLFLNLNRSARMTSSNNKGKYVMFFI